MRDQTSSGSLASSGSLGSRLRQLLKRRNLRYLAGRLSPRLFYWLMGNRERRVFESRLAAHDGSLKTTHDSRERYEEYDNREQRAHEQDIGICSFGGRIVKMPLRQMREEYLKYLYEEIESALRLSDATSSPMRVLEVGCGNGINLVSLKERFSDQLHLTGLDTSPRRIDVARSHYGERLDGVEFSSVSITEAETFADDSFDVVYSMHCLEQIPYQCRDAVRQMHRVARSKVVMIEPVFELGNPAQRLYLYNADHNRILLKTVRQLGYSIRRLQCLDIQSNPLNQSSILVVDKQHDAASRAA